MRKDYHAEYYLYAKGWYERFTGDNDFWADLRKIHSVVYGVDVKHITRTDVLRTLIHLVEKNHNVSLLDFLSDINPVNVWRVWKADTDYNDYDFHTAVASKCLSILNVSSVRNNDDSFIRNIGMPDPNVLPITKQAETRIKEGWFDETSK